jgi:transposase
MTPESSPSGLRGKDTATNELPCRIVHHTTTAGKIANFRIVFSYGNLHDNFMPRKPRCNEAQIRRILELHDKGTRLRDICHEMGLPHSAVQSVLRKHGRNPHPRRILRGERLAHAVHMREAGASYRAIGRVFDVSEATVRSEFRRAAIKGRPRGRFPRKLKREILRRYNAGESSTALARVYNCCEQSIRNVVLSAGGQMRPKRKLDRKTQLLIADDYDTGLNTSQIASKYDVCRGTIRNYILGTGRRLRGPREVHRTRALDTHAFRNPTDECLYWVGFLLADGNVMDNGMLTVALQAADREHLVKFRRFLKADALIRDKCLNQSAFKPGALAVHLSVHSRDLCEDLRTYGIKPRKSTKEKLRMFESSRHVWRGVIDGDGTLGFHKRGYFHLKLYGSRQLCNQFRKFVLAIVPGCRAKTRKSRGIYAFGLCCGPAVAVARELYRDCSLYLDRKFAVVRRLFERDGSK